MKFIYLLLFPLLLFSQNNSEKNKLKLAIDSTTQVAKKAQLLTDLAWEYIITDNDSALLYANKALEISKLKNYKLGKAIALETKGLYFEIVKGNYELASKYYFEGIAICEKNNLNYSISIYHTLGAMFHSSDNYEKAKEYYNIAYNLAKKEQDSILQKKCLINLGSIASSLKNYKKAEELFLESLKLKVRKEYNFSVYANLGNLYIREKKYHKALPFLEKATSKNPKNSDSEENLHFLIDVKTALKDTLGMQNILVRAKKYLKKPINKRYKSIMLYSISNYYEAFNNYENALRYKNKYLEIFEEIKKEQRDETVYDLETKYKTEKVQRQLEKHKSAQKILYIILIFIGLLLALISFFLYKNRKKNLLLAKQKEILETNVNEKEMLLKEIHHRVKNNLQVVSSLLNLQQRQIKNEKTKLLFQESRDRVKAMSLIHQNLHQINNLTGVDITSYFKNLVTNLVKNYKIDQHKIEVIYDVTNLKLDINTIIPLGLIVNELISNILKYAFKNQENGIIKINLNEIESDIVLMVEDNGIGMPKDFVIEETTSLGFKLIKAFSQKLNAKLTIDNSVKGAKIVIEIPNK